MPEIFQSAITVPKISECHSLTSSGNHVLATKLFFSQELNEDDKIDQSIEIDSNASGDWGIQAEKVVAVHLAGKRREITKVYMAWH